MVKMLAGIVMLLSLMVSQAKAENFYIAENHDHWVVYGNYGTEKVNASCIMRQSYNNGSFFSLISDLENGELYFIIKNTDWHLPFKPGPHKFALSFIFGDKKVDQPVTYMVIDENTMVLQNLREEFIEAMAAEGALVVGLPDLYLSPRIPLTEARLAFESMLECFEKSRKVIFNPTKGQKAINHEESYRNIEHTVSYWL